MLVQGDGVKPLFFRVAGFIQKMVVIVGAFLAVKMCVGHREESLVLQNNVFLDVTIRTFGKVRYFHVRFLCLVWLRVV